MSLNTIAAAKQQNSLNGLALRAAPYADRNAAAVPSPTLMALDTRGISKLNRSAVQEVAQFNSNILAQNPKLLRLKYRLMAFNPFSFLRGSDHLFYHDMQRIEGQAMDAGPKTILQGDMHLANFGSMTRPDGKTFLALNDFDEAYIGPAKLDLKRLATSVVLAGKQAKFRPDQTRQFVSDFANSYHDTMQSLVQQPRTLDSLTEPKLVHKTLDGGRAVDEKKWMAARTEIKSGRLMFRRKATVTSVSPRTEKALKGAFEQYRKGLPDPIAKHLSHYKVSDAVSAVAGTGSVGRARYRLLLTSAGGHPPLMLEMKEEVPAAMAPYVGTPNVFGAQANRDLNASAAMDGTLDPYFGRVKIPKRDALESSSFLVRRVEPTKSVVDPTTIRDPGQFSELMKFYGQEVAISHAAGDKAGLSGAKDILSSLGPKKDFSSELVNFGHNYAQQVERDWSSFKAALVKDPLLLKAVR